MITVFYDVAALYDKKACASAGQMILSRKYSTYFKEYHCGEGKSFNPVLLGFSDLIINLSKNIRRSKINKKEKEEIYVYFHNSNYIDMSCFDINNGYFGKEFKKSLSFITSHFDLVFRKNEDIGNPLLEKKLSYVERIAALHLHENAKIDQRIMKELNSIPKIEKDLGPLLHSIYVSKMPYPKPQRNKLKDIHFFTNKIIISNHALKQWNKRVFPTEDKNDIELYLFKSALKGSMQHMDKKYYIINDDIVCVFAYDEQLETITLVTTYGRASEVPAIGDIGYLLRGVDVYGKMAI